MLLSSTDPQCTYWRSLQKQFNCFWPASPKFGEAALIFRPDSEESLHQNYFDEHPAIFEPATSHRCLDHRSLLYLREAKVLITEVYWTKRGHSY